MYMRVPHGGVKPASPTRDESDDFLTGCTNPDSSPSRTLTLNTRLRLQMIIYIGPTFEMTDIVLRHLFPSEKRRIHDLRPRAHNFTLPLKDNNNFLPIECSSCFRILDLL